MHYVDNEGPDQPAHSYSQVRISSLLALTAKDTAQCENEKRRPR